MKDFKFHSPTKLFFGKDQIKVLANQLKTLNARRVLLVYGKSSLKKMGLYDRIISIFKEKDIFFKELSGVKPNPSIESVREGAKICKENNIELVLAAGAGSVLDCSKAIAAAAKYEGDPWDFNIGKKRITSALPIATILTLSATGSESNAGAVITNEETKQKLPLHSEHCKPVFSILDPQNTFSVSPYQTAAGTVDIMSHVFEQYFSANDDAYISDRLCEVVLKTCVNYVKDAIKKGDDYESRANLMWASTIGLNNLLSCGKITDWATHLIEHELSAYYDLTHGAGLSIITLSWMRYVLDKDNYQKFCDLGKTLFDMDEQASYDKAKRFIDRLEKFFLEIGMPVKLSEVNITDEYFDDMCENIKMVFGTVGNFRKLYPDDVRRILVNSL
ncbi:MAG: NADH-dependent alcohol dehydrogenase [Candidatus Muiribacterium halophilum]|uniref:NADH-dependent alcohol dehydrogenase n=1 Tax=Muiribacterium halophilum TaxID=2053465 RepID=A0A2N5ZE46_MUIH1|nr:MAG: NADH-dependent alcohol dehydrogenase [Candidatus Muirbacterium halophilum]